MSELVSKEDFKEYEEVRKSGKYNMFDPNARLSTSLDRGQWVEIMTNYNKYKKEYNDEKD